MEKVILDHIKNNKIFEDDVTLTDTNDATNEEKVSDEKENVEESSVEEINKEESSEEETNEDEANVEEASLEETNEDKANVTGIEESVQETKEEVAIVEEANLQVSSVKKDVVEEKKMLTSNLIDVSINNIFNEKEFNSINSKRSYNITFFDSNNEIIKTTTSKLSLQFCKARKTFYIIFDNKVSLYLRINPKSKTITNFYLTKKPIVFSNHFKMSLGEVKRFSVN